MWTTLYLVKASFLALIWSIFKVSPRFQVAWWIIAIYTFLTFWVVLLSLLWQCGSPSLYDSAEVCYTLVAYYKQVNTEFAQSAFHDASD